MRALVHCVSDKLVFRRTAVLAKQMIDVQTRRVILLLASPVNAVFIYPYRGNNDVRPTRHPLRSVIRKLFSLMKTKFRKTAD